MKGKPYVLVKDGGYHHSVMRKKSVSQHDIEEDMRLSAKVEDIGEIQVDEGKDGYGGAVDTRTPGYAGLCLIKLRSPLCSRRVTRISPRSGER